MTTFRAENERIKRAYFIYLKEAKRRSEPSVDAAAKALNRFEVYTRFKSFKTFCPEQAIAFKEHLAKQVSLKTNQTLSKATAYATLTDLRAFFRWLPGQSGFKKLTYSDADFFSLSLKDTAIAKTPNEKRAPTVAQVHHVLAVMPNRTDIERRNRALIAFALLTCARVDAIASTRIKHVDLERGLVIQDAREVRTKFSKTFPTFFFPVGGEAKAILSDWVTFLRRDRLWEPDDPLFPATRIVLGADFRFEAVGLDRKTWSNSTPIRKIFREAFLAASLPYFNPHSFRDTLGALGERVCRTPEELKAWSQNMAHESVLTTLRNYGAVSAERQGEIIRNAGSQTPQIPDLSELIEVVDRLTRKAAR